MGVRANSNGGCAPVYTGPAASTRTWRARLHAAAQSERTAWAVQNAVGAAFAALFTVVVDLQFTLACLCAVLYSASSLVLSLDRSLGGRLFGGTIFIGTVLTGASVGGGLVSLAWLARGSGVKALVDYLPASLQTIPDLPTIQRLKDAVAWLTTLPLPPLLQQMVDEVVDVVSRELYGLIPAVSSAYWALLMVLAAVAFFPLAVARADRDFGRGVIIAIVFVFLSSMLVFGSLMPSLGEDLFWTEVVIGYFKLALVAAAANVLAGSLVYVRSAHDDVRRGCAAVLQGLGVRISRLGSAANRAPAAAASSTRPAEQEDQAALGGLQGGVQGYVDWQVAECCKAAACFGTVNKQEAPPGESTLAGLAPLPAGASEAELQLTWASLAVSMKTARLEPPLPLLCSQPGASPDRYGVLHKALTRLQRAVVVLGRGQAGCLQALASTAGAAGEVAARLRAVLARSMAVSAAACAGAAQALAHMPVLAPCSGTALSWRPLAASAWQQYRAELANESCQLAARYRCEFEERGLEFALSLGVDEHRALLFALVAAAEVLDCAQAAEAAAAAALEVPLAAAQGAPAKAPADPPAEEVSYKESHDSTLPEDVEAGKVGVPLGSNGCAPGPAPPSSSIAPQAAQRAPLLRRLAANPYVSSCAILLLLCSPLPAVKLTADACMRMAKAVPALLRSQEARSAALRNPLVHFAFKYWLAMTSAVVAITAIMWKAVPGGEGPLQDANQQINFFVVWQPIYASITVAICLQDTVESSLFRGILRSTMTVLGGTLGYLVMLNGSLANNPYWVVAWVAVFSALAGLLAPDRTLRYSLFLFVFTANAVVVCQYIGCCGVAGDPEVFAGKIVSTVIGSTLSIFFGWVVLPYYGSSRMLGDQAAALQACLEVMRRMLSEVSGAAADGRAICTDGWLEAIDEGVQVPLARVSADAELNLLDKRQMPLTWHLLPEPVVLHLMRPALGMLHDRLASAALVLRRDLFDGSPCTPALGAGPNPTPALAGKPVPGSQLAGPASHQVVPGPVFRTVMAELATDVEGMVASLGTLVAACTANMKASAAGSGLKPQRAAVAEAVAAVQAARLHLHQRYLETQPAALEGAGGHAGGDFACMAWLHAVLRCVDEMVVAASMLLQDAAQDRDVLGSWLRAWRGQRVPPR